MIHCHECGSEIADIDTFCPYCGISLKPVAADEDDSVYDNTIAVGQDEMSELLQKTETPGQEGSSETDSEKEDKISAETPASGSAGEKSADESPAGHAIGSGSALSVDESDEIKSPTEQESPGNMDQTLIGFSVDEPTPGADSAAASAEHFARDKKDLPDTETNDEPGRNYTESEADVPEEEKSSENLEYDRSEASEYKEEVRASADDPEDESIDDVLESAKIGLREDVSQPLGETGNESPQEETDAGEDEKAAKRDMEFSNTIPYTPENILKHSGKFKDEDKQIVSSAGDEEEKAIEIPQEPIETEETGESRFDSVRIMQDKDSDPVTLLKDFDSQRRTTEAHDSGAAVSMSVEPKPAEEKARSVTTPNMGGSETDGSRKGLKLKPLAEGTTLNGRYEIVRKIGGGGMGAVYLATDKNLGGILRAVKEMVQSYIEEEAQEKAISDFKRESMLLTSLDHPSIPTIYDYFFDEKEARFYLVMKYISGGDLASRLRSASEGRIDELSVTEWAVQIADVLDYLHNRQPPIVYRDLKPSNIMIDGNTGRVMIIDFGIARWINKEEKGVTAVGTMGYAPPELFSGNVEPRSDIYSLGSTMFHLLTGADPQSNPLLIFDFQKHPRPRQINPRLSDQMEKILMKAVEYNAENRFSSAGEMRDVLSEHLRSLKGGNVSFGVTKTPPAVSLADQTVFCGFCGQKIVATDLFCAFCGSKQPLAQQGVHSTDYAPPVATARLMIVGTNDLETPAFDLEKDENLLGRRDPLSNIFPEIDLSKFDPQTKVSRRHARIWREGEKYLIEDLGSSNGTLVTRVVGDTFRLVPHQPHPLTNGEKLKVGDTTLHFVVG